MRSARTTPRRAFSHAGGALALFATLAGLGCHAADPQGCLAASGPTCVPPTPCARLTYGCRDGYARAFRLTDPAQRPPGLAALASVGDYVLANDRLVAVIDAPDHPHYLGMTGGRLIDLAPRGGADHLHYICAATGVLPDDMARFDTAEILASADGVSVVVRGTLGADRRVEMVTRYELRPCDPGVRIRSEIYNGGRTVWPMFPMDFVMWGTRGMTPFVPLRGQGFSHPDFDPTDLDPAWRVFPWVAAQSHVAPHASYAIVACDARSLEGVNSIDLSAVGHARVLVRPGDGVAHERMIFAADGAGLSGAQSLATEAHGRLYGERTVVVSGRAVGAAGAPVGGDERRASLLFYEFAPDGSDAPREVTPWAEVVPGEDGRFQTTLLAGRRYRAQVHRLGRPVGPPRAVDLTGTAPSHDLGDVRVEAPARLTVRVTDARGVLGVDSEVILTPTGATRAHDVIGTTHGVFDEGCAPWLGSPYGGSPSCNRALAPGGDAAFDVAPGTYFVYATAGPESTLARAQITLAEGESATVTLALTRLVGLLPAGALAADLHVHGGRSADSAMPDRDRVLTFLAAGVDVIAATDHDVCTSYREAVEALGVGDRVAVMSGVETTGQLPFMYPPGSRFPRVIGHLNFWPLPYDPAAPRNGAPWDEFLQPAELFEQMRARIGPRGVIQLNHPTAPPVGGLDQGYLRVIGVSPLRPLPGRDDGTGPGALYSRAGTQHRNLDFDVQEVMNGASLLQNLQYRSIWHAFLSQGVIRAGTANSDSHSLRIEPLGYPRNVVLGDFVRGRFAPDAFNTAVREGHVIGTNGPVIEATIAGAQGARWSPGVASITPDPSATLELAVRAAPWIPVAEVRVVVNGRVVRTVHAPEIATPPDPFGLDGTLRWRASLRVADLLNGRDGWIVVEAGSPLPTTRDSDGDGLVDRLDSDGDGVANELAVATPTEQDPRFHVNVVAPGTWPMAFTNPFLVDLRGDGWEAPGR